MKGVKIFIYHDEKNKILVVNFETKLFYISSDENIIKIFRSQYTQMNIYSILFSDVINLIDEMKQDGFKQLL